MLDQPQVLRMAVVKAQHAAARQGLISENTANADTPGYAARDLPDFAEVMEQGPGLFLRRTRPGHAVAERGEALFGRPLASGGGEAAPNGNDVSLEHEMLRAVDVRRSHDQALAIYRSGMGILRSALGRR